MGDKKNNGEPAVYKTGLEEILPLIMEVITVGGVFSFKPSGKSMLPFIREGLDSVKVASADSPQKYDIVLYRRHNGQFVLHRIIGVKSTGFVLCGDNQWQKEYGVTKDMIIAQVAEIDRAGRNISVDNKGYRFLVHLWCDFFIVRKFYLRFRNLVRRMLDGE